MEPHVVQDRLTYPMNHPWHGDYMHLATQDIQVLR